MTADRPHSSSRRPTRAAYRVIAASKVLEVRAAGYTLHAELQDGLWCPALSLRDGEALVTWTGIADGVGGHPFRRTYLVRADERAFELRFETDFGASCRLRGEAAQNTVRIALCNDASLADASLALVAALRGGSRVASAEEVAWDSCRLRVRAGLGTVTIDRERLVLARGANVREIASDAPLGTGYCFAEMDVEVAPADST